MYNNIALLIGHMIGDYVLQNDWMALNKQRRDPLGFMACMVHCMLYAAAIATCIVVGGWRWSVRPEDWVHAWGVACLIAFVTHFPIDRYGLAGKWIKFFGQTTPDQLEKVNVARFVHGHPDTGLALKDAVEVYTTQRQYFWAPVYIAIDNTWHLLLMWLLFSWTGS